MADTGWVLAGAGASNASNGGTVAWSDPENITASDDVWGAVSTAVVGLYTFTEWLKASNFGLNVPDEATIDGIELRVEAHGVRTGGLGFIDRVNLYKDDNAPATEPSLTVVLPESDATDDFGGPSDLWGLSWSASDINAASFQARWAGTGWDVTFGCDAMWIKVHYTEGEAPPAGGGSIARSGIFG